MKNATAQANGRLGSGDVFEVRVYGEPDLSGIFRVDSEGWVKYPLVGRVKVVGLSSNDVADVISTALRRYLKTADVSVLIKQNNSKRVYVLGRVRSPGTFLYEDGMNIIQALTLAGGLDNLSDANGTLVTRVIDGAEQRFRVSVNDIGEGKSQNVLLQPGDIVYVPETIF